MYVCKYNVQIYYNGKHYNIYVHLLYKYNKFTTSQCTIYYNVYVFMFVCMYAYIVHILYLKCNNCYIVKGYF
jgi:hypothetical protein